jgi:MFS family permease
VLGAIAAARRRLPSNVRALSWVSFANDFASELVYPIVPLFLTVTLGAPATVLGVVEGIAEGTAVGLRGVAGRLSDRAGGRRKPWIIAGYGVSAVSRIALAAAWAWGVVLVGRVADRLGKAARTAPRDALIRDSTPATLRGAAFGYHRAFDTAGAVAGPLLAVALLAAGVSLRTVLIVAVAPGFLTLVLLRAVREATVGGESLPRTERPEQLPSFFWGALVVWTIFSLGNSSDAFLILRAHDLGLSPMLVVLAYAGYNVIYSGLSWPLGALSDRVPRTLILGAGLAVFAFVYTGFALAPGSWAVWPLFAVYGVYIAATDGIARAWVGDYAPARAGGTAYGVFSAATGAALLAASVVAGLLWSHVDPSAPFWLGVGSAGVGLAALVVFERYRMRRAPTKLDA